MRSAAAKLPACPTLQVERTRDDGAGPSTAGAAEGAAAAAAGAVAGRTGGPAEAAGVDEHTEISPAGGEGTSGTAGGASAGVSVVADSHED